MPKLARLTAAALALIATAACSEPASSPSEADQSPEGAETALFAGGCFWCVEQAFDQVAGVTGTVSGYTGGDVPEPTYEQVSAGGTGHYEALKVTYDPDRVGYAELLQTFWHNVDPTDPDGQFCDQGDQYRSAVFVAGARQRRLAEASKKALQEDPEAPAPITTEILDAGPFYPAEAYHQDYYDKNPIRYGFYKHACGRKARLEALWGERAGKP